MLGWVFNCYPSLMVGQSRRAGHWLVPVMLPAQGHPCSSVLSQPHHPSLCQGMCRVRSGSLGAAVLCPSLHSLPRSSSMGSWKASALTAAVLSSVPREQCHVQVTSFPTKPGWGWGAWLWASWYLRPLLPGCLLFPEHLPQYSIMAQLILTFFLTK